MKAPYKIFYSNDTVNTVSCTSPYHARGEPFSQALLEASVDETAGTGIDAHMLQPGLTMVPWWKSRQYPYAEHIRWYEQTYQTRVRDNPYAHYMLEGGDMVGAFVARCRLRGLAPFISLRMNDSHGKEFVDTVGGGDIGEIPGYALHCVNRFYKDNPQFRIDSDPTRVGKAHWNTRVLNWANPEVVDWMFGFITEICEGYDIDGLELDFMRHCNFFRDGTSVEERAGIMSGFAQRVRHLLDRTERRGRHRWLGVRIPCYVAALEPLGLDPRALSGAGVEIFNLSSYYQSVQQTDVAAIRMRAPTVTIVQEVTHSVANVGSVPGAYDTALFLRTTDEQFYTAAHLAYARGADGMSAFNFAYFREYGAAGRGPFNEPPFHIFARMRDREWLGRQPQHYFLSTGASWATSLGYAPMLPKSVKPGAQLAVTLDLAPPTGGWKTGGRLRIRARADLGASVWEVRMNGRELVESGDRAAPYRSPYDAAHRPAGDRMRAWKVPASLLVAGENMFEFTHRQGSGAAQIELIDLGVE